MASPSKDQYIEGKVYTDEGEGQGTVLVKVKRIYSPGAQGRFILSDYLSASDKQYREWVLTKRGRVTTVDGSYHLCKSLPGECAAAGQHEITVHIGQWRIWKEDELLDGQYPDGYNKEAQNLIGHYFKREGLGKDRTSSSRLPWNKERELIGPEEGQSEENRRGRARSERC